MDESAPSVPQRALERLGRAPRLVFATASGAFSLLCLAGLFRLL